MRDGMTRLLLSTSALALASGAASFAEAADWQIAVGGYFETYAAYASPDVDGIVNEEAAAPVTSPTRIPATMLAVTRLFSLWSAEDVPHADALSIGYCR